MHITLHLLANTFASFLLETSPLDPCLKHLLSCIYTIAQDKKKTPKRGNPIGWEQNFGPNDFIHQGMGPRYQKMKWHQYGITFLSNLGCPNSRKYSSSLIWETNLQVWVQSWDPWILKSRSMKGVFWISNLLGGFNQGFKAKRTPWLRDSVVKSKVLDPRSLREGFHSQYEILKMWH